MKSIEKGLNKKVFFTSKINANINPDNALFWLMTCCWCYPLVTATAIATATTAKGQTKSY
jgi:hypothetical protein